MADEVAELDGVRALVCSADGPPLSGYADVVELMGLAFGHRAEVVVAPVARLDPGFFDLRTGIAGEIVGKLSGYGLRLVVVGDISAYVAASSSFAAFVAEANRGRAVRFTPSLDDVAREATA